MKKLFQLTVGFLLIFFLFITCSKDDILVVQYSLSVEVSPAEGGSVSPSVGSFDEGVSKTITATPSSEYVFKNWLGGVNGTDNPTTVIMNSNKTITAIFEKKMYAFNILYEGEGSVSSEVEGLNTDGTISSGSKVQLTSIPVEGWEFVSWSGDITSIENPLTLTMDETKEITAIFQPILYNQILGKWDIDNLSNKPSSNKSSSTQDDTISSKTTDGECVVYSLVFNSDGTFILSLSSGEIQGTFTFDSVNSIVLTNVGSLTNISITSGALTFSLSLTNSCSIDGNADNDDDYEEGECVSFLNCNDGNVWVKQLDTGSKYVRVTNDLENVWLEHYTFDTDWQCIRKEVTNLNSQYPIILLENDLTQMTYALDDTSEGDVTVILNVTADNKLSVSYDYNDDLLDNADYYELSTQGSINEYLNTYTTCIESQTDSDLDGVTDDIDTCPDTPQGEEVNSSGCSESEIDSDGDGVTDNIDECPNTPAGEVVNTSGCAESEIDSDGDGVTDNIDECPNTPAGEVVNDSGCAEKTYVPDDNFEQKLIDLGYDDILDDYVLTANIENITSLNSGNLYNLQSQTIIDFTGIEDFVNLTKLFLGCDCPPLSIVNFDITKLVKLEELAINYQLTSLDVSSNTALTNLNLYNMQLASIDVSANTALTTLNVGGNQLTSIDVSANTALTDLNLCDNQLTSIDVSANTALTTLNVGGNQLTSIDVSANTALTDLYLYDNQLTSIDVSANTALTRLVLRNNQLTSIDVSANTALTALQLQNNQLTKYRCKC